MAQTLNLAIKGQLHSEEVKGTNYIFPKDGVDYFSCIDSDPGVTTQALGLSGAGTESYTIAETTNGIIYAYRRILPERGDCAMVAIHVGGPTVDGCHLRDRLVDIMNYALKEKSSSSISDDIIGEKVSGCLDLFDWGKGPNPSTQEKNKSTKNDAYRVYESEEKLYDYLENPFQPSYAEFKAIHLIPAKSKPVPANGSGIRKIDTPIEKTYFFVLPEGVQEKDSKRHVGEKEYFTLIYGREKYENVQVNNLRVGNDNKYFKVDGEKIIVKNSDEAKIRFSKYITFKVSDEKNVPINEFIIQIKIKGDNKWIQGEIRDRRYERLKGKDGQKKLLLEDGQYEYIIESDGYNKKKDSVDTRSINGFCDVCLNLQSDEQELFLIPAFMGKKVASSGQKEKVSINYTKNNVFYKKYADVLGPYKSQTPLFYVMKKKPKPRIIVLSIISLLVGFVLGIGAGYLEWNKKNPETPTANIGLTQAAQEQDVQLCESEEEPEVATMAQEDEDVVYLNSNNTWRMDKIKSSHYKDFFEKGVANGQSFDVFFDGNNYPEITNQKWREIYDEHIHPFIDAKKENKTFNDANRIAYWDMINNQQIQKNKTINLDDALMPAPKKETAGANTNSSKTRSTSTKK